MTLLAILLAFSVAMATAVESKQTSPRTEGDSVPNVVFKTRVRIDADETVENPFDWLDRTSLDYFQGKRTVVFAIPGAFTPTCSASHLPGYHDLYKEIQSYGIDQVYCLSVNDAFVMRQWGLHQGLDEDKTPGSMGFTTIQMIPDGAALFTRAMGMSTLWDTERGFGERSWRYSMVVNDMIIEKIFIEDGKVTQNSASDPFQVSDANTMMAYLKQAMSIQDEL